MVAEKSRTSTGVARRRDADATEALAALGVLAAHIAHDLNNLLTAVVGDLALLTEALAEGSEPLTTAERGLGVEALAAARRCGALTRRLVDYARAGSSAPGPVDLGAVVRGMVDILDWIVGDAIALDLSIDDDPPLVLGDVEAIEMALLNLAVNAREAMPGGGTLSLTVARDGDRVRLSVADSGVGMARAEIAQALERAHTTKRSGGGLGLAIVRNAVATVGGRVEIASKTGAGTTVTLEFQRLAPSPPAVSEAAGGGKRRVLVIERDAARRRAAARRLEAEGHTVVEAVDSAAALRLLGRGEVDLIVCDVDGLDDNGGEAEPS